jgi:signal transduction histidine kinase
MTSEPALSEGPAMPRGAGRAGVAAFAALIDRLVHPAVRADAELRFRSRILVGILLFFAMANLWTGWSQGSDPAVASISLIAFAIAASTGATLAALRMSRRYVLPCALFLCQLAVYGIAISLANADTGLSPVLSPSLVILPTVGAFLFDRRAGIALVVFVVCLSIALEMIAPSVGVALGGAERPLAGLVLGSTAGAIVGTVFFNAITIAGLAYARRLGAERDGLLAFRAEFMTTASHELRTPTTAIVGALDLLSAGTAGPLPPEAARLVDIARRNAKMMAKLIGDMLDIERYESGAMRVDFRPIDLLDVVRAAIDLNEGYARQFGVRYVLAPIIGPATVVGDALRLTQVMSNLLSNAAKFAPSGSDVDISLERSPGWLRVRVVDRGPGIPPSVRDRIFERFARLHDETSGEVRGSGLGLSIAKSFVEMHSGRIGFDSAPPGGAAFWFELPAGIAPRPSAAA